MTDLSPAAQAVLKAVTQRLYSLDPEYVPRSASEHGMSIAAVLRAAADQVVPEFWHEEGDIYAETKHDVRADLLAIADELEGAQ